MRSPAGSRTITPTSIRCTPARCSSRRIPWRARRYALAQWINPNNHALDGGRASSAHGEGSRGADRAHVRMGARTSATSAAAARWPTSRRSGSPGSSRRAKPSSRRPRRTTRTAASAPCSGSRSRRSPATRAAAWTRTRCARGSSAAASARWSRRWARPRPAPSIRCRRSSSSPARHGVRVHADAAYGGYFGLAGNLGADARAAFDRLGEADSIVDRSAQARAAALRLRLRALPRPVGRTLLQARLALHLLQLDGAPPGRDQPRVLAAGGRRGRALGDAAAVAARARRRVRRGPRGLPRGGARAARAPARGPALRDRLRARARHRRLGAARRSVSRGVGARARRSSTRPPGATCTWRWRSCRPNSSTSRAPGWSGTPSGSPACARC